VNITFDEVWTTKSKSGVCPVCGGRTTRTKKFVHTVNPYNKNPDGSIKSLQEVFADVHAEASDWDPDFTHAKCLAA